MSKACRLTPSATKTATLNKKPFGLFICGNQHPQPVSPAARQTKYLIVAIQYFTKWIEVEPVTIILAQKVHSFVWKNVVCRFDIPRQIISDNGTQFANKQLKEVYVELGIKQKFAFIKHPQTNGQAESANKVLLHGLKRRLEKAKGG